MRSGKVLRKGISNVVAGLILAIVIGVAMLAFINWARVGVVERVPTRLLGPCPAYVTAVYDSGFYNVYVAYPRGKVEEVLVVTEPGDVYSCPRDFKKECCSDEKYGAFYSARVRYMPVAYICRGETYRVTVYPYAAGFAAPWEQRLFTAVIRTTYNSSRCSTPTGCCNLAGWSCVIYGECIRGSYDFTWIYAPNPFANPKIRETWFWLSSKTPPPGDYDTRYYYYYKAEDEAPPWVKERVGKVSLYRVGYSCGGSVLPQCVTTYSFALTYIARVYLPQDGNYVFEVSSDDGIKAWLIDEKGTVRKIIDAWGAQQLIKRPAQLPDLKAGWYTLKVVYFQLWGEAFLAIGVRLPDGTWVRPLRNAYGIQIQPVSIGSCVDEGVGDGTTCCCISYCIGGLVPCPQWSSCLCRSAQRC
jgi:hypothetical protein